MSENNQTNQNEEPKKKMSLQEAMKQQLENKKTKLQLVLTILIAFKIRKK